MKLFFGGLSPFVRKVMITAHELGVVDEIRTQPAMVTPFQTNDDVAAVNPLGKIPAAVLDNGAELYGSTVICEYLDATHGAGKIFPTDASRWNALRLAALGDGILEAGSLARIETLRPEGMQWNDWRCQQIGKVNRSLASLEADIDSLETETVMIGEISIGCALGWLDVRLPDVAWRTEYPKLAGWFDAISQRSSFDQTKPVLPK